MGLRFFIPRMLGGTATATGPAAPQGASRFDAAFSSVAGGFTYLFGNEVDLDGVLVTVIHDEDTEIIFDSSTGTEFERLAVWIDKSILEVPRAGLRLIRKNLPNDRAFISNEEWVDEGDAWKMMFLRAIPRQFGTDTMHVSRG